MFHRGLTPLAISITTLLLCGAAVAADPLAGWDFSNGPEFPGAKGGLAWNAKEGHAGGGCAEVQFNFDGGGNYVAAMYAVKADESMRRARLWLKKPGRNRITFRATDSGGQTFQKFIDYQVPDWQQIEVDLSAWTHSWGGPKDGKVRWPIKAFGVVYENDGGAKRGSYFIDGLEMLPAEKTAPPGTLRSWYAAATFTADERWRTTGGIKSFENGLLTYELGATGATGSLVRDYSMFGRPLRLRVRVQSDGSGNELSVTLGSHFQNFHRSLGRLDAAGEKTFEVELGKLEGWRYSDGENDGVAQLPLRLGSLTLTRTGATGTGEIKLLGVEVETEYTPATSVVLIPDPWVDGEQAVFHVTARNLSARPVKGTLAFEARGMADVIRSDAATLQLPAGGAPVKHTFNCPMTGRDFAEGAFTFSTADFRTAEVTTTAARLPKAGPISSEASPIGMGVYLYRFGGASIREATLQMRKLATTARQAGVRWTREEFSWSSLEPQRGKWNWAFYDAMVKTAHENGLEVYGLLCYWPGYPEAASFAYTEKGIGEYVNYVRQVVRRYKGTIKYWEVWNEPNIFFWSGPKELYAKTLKAAYAAIKEEDPEAKVLGCSTAGISASFIQKVMDEGGPFDILTIHPYRGTLHMPTFIDELKRTSEQVGGRPVWITEMGWPTSLVGGVSERKQAGLVARTYLSAIASGVVGSVSWYDFRNDFDDPFYNESQFGVLRRDMRPKAGYLALATIGRHLGSHKVVGTVDLGDGLIAHRFSAGEEDVIALSSLEEDRAVSLRISPAPKAVLDAVGQAIAVGKDGTLNLALLDGWPAYVFGPKGMTAQLEKTPLQVAAEPAFAEAGGTVKLNVTMPGEAKSLKWRCPPGWSVSEKDGSWSAVVPASQEPAGVRLIASCELAGQTLHVPVTVTVRPKVMRVP